MYKYLILLLFIISCKQNYSKKEPLKNLASIDYKLLSGQNNLNIDSLYTICSLRKDDSIKVNNLITIFRLSIKNKPIRNDVLEDGLKISKKINYETGIANILNREGVNARYQHHYVQSVKLHKEALKYYKQSWDIHSKIKNLNSLGVSYRKLNLEEEALKHYYEALKLSEKSKDLKSVAIALNGIGNAFIDLKKYNESIQYFKLALHLEKENHNLRGMGYDYSNLGEVFMYKKMYDSSYAYHIKSLNIAKKINYKENKAIIYNTLGQMFLHKGSFKESLNYFEKSIPDLEKYHNKRYLSNTKINMGKAQEMLGMPKEAEKNLKYGLQLAKEISSKENIILGYDALSSFYENKNIFKRALEENKLMTIYHDSMFNMQSEAHIAAMEIKYNSEKKDAQINQLNLENRIQKSSILTQFMAIGLLVFVMLFFFFYNKLRNKNRNLELSAMRHKIEIYLQQITRLEQQEDYVKKEIDITKRGKDFGLSTRESEVMNCISQGMKNQEIANKLFISLSTVKTHTKNIFEKLDVRNRIEATRKTNTLY